MGFEIGDLTRTTGENRNSWGCGKGSGGVRP